jgi:hypothetical protein
VRNHSAVFVLVLAVLNPSPFQSRLIRHSSRKTPRKKRGFQPATQQTNQTKRTSRRLPSAANADSTISIFDECLKFSSRSTCTWLTFNRSLSRPITRTPSRSLPFENACSTGSHHR